MCGTALPEGEFVEIAGGLVVALTELKDQCRFDDSKAMLDGAISWLRRTYL